MLRTSAVMQSKIEYIGWNLPHPFFPPKSQNSHRMVETPITWDLECLKSQMLSGHPGRVAFKTAFPVSSRTDPVIGYIHFQRRRDGNNRNWPQLDFELGCSTTKPSALISYFKHRAVMRRSNLTCRRCPARGTRAESQYRFLGSKFSRTPWPLFLFWSATSRIDWMLSRFFDRG